jgi:type III secretory pathway component EscS
MNAYLGKAFIIAILLAGFAGVYFRTPLGDRSFALGVWLVFSLIAGGWVLLMPVLCCPNCGRATAYFDNYSERQDSLTGGNRRHVKCKHCHSVIDRLNGTVVHRLTAVDGRNLDRIRFLLSMWLVLMAAGILLIGVSIVVGIIEVLITLESRANDHALIVGIGCVGVFVTGLLLVAIGWGMKRRAHRFAEQNRIQFPNKVRIRR